MELRGRWELEDCTQGWVGPRAETNGMRELGRWWELGVEGN